MPSILKLFKRNNKSKRGGPVINPKYAERSSRLNRFWPTKNPKAANNNVLALKLERENQRSNQNKQSIIAKLAKFKYIILGVVAVLTVLAIFIALVSYANSQKIFSISTINVTGNKQISTLQILSATQNSLGQNLFSLNARSLQENIIKEIPYIKQVFVYKSLPNVLNIEVQESFPVLAYISYIGIYLVDDTKEVVETIAKDDQSILTTYENDLINDTLSLDNEYVIQFYIQSLNNPESAKDLDWSKVDPQIKQNTYNLFKEQTLQKVSSLLQSKVDLFKQSEYANLPLVIDAANINLNLKDLLPAKIYTTATGVHNFLTTNNISAAEYKWLYGFQLSVQIVSGPTILFSSRRSLQDQFNDYLALQVYGKIGSASLIDLQEEVVSVK